MIALFMAEFGKECFAFFNTAALDHFKTVDGQPFEISNNHKKNTIRIWQKINEEQRDSVYV